MQPSQILTHYENLVSISTGMLDFARAGDRQGLIEAQKRCAAVIDELRQAPEPELNLEQQRRKLQLIQAVLYNDREIRGITEPWLAELGNLIRGCAMQRKVGKLYR